MVKFPWKRLTKPLTCSYSNHLVDWTIAAVRFRPEADATKAKLYNRRQLNVQTIAMISTEMRVHVLLSTQRALLGHIGPAVRRILCRWTESEIHVRVVFDGEISEIDAEAMSEAATEVIADFPPRTAIFFGLERCDSPARVKHDNDEVAVFQRLEQ